jgi:hypothetical protein
MGRLPLNNCPLGASKFLAEARHDRLLAAALILDTDLRRRQHWPRIFYSEAIGTT